MGVCALALAGCGSSPTQTAATSGGDGGAGALLARAAAALRTASSYHITGMLDPGLDVDLVVFPRGVTGTMSERGATWQVVALDHAVWIRGASLWRATLPAAQAAALGDGWVRVTQSAAAYGRAGLLGSFDDVVATQVFGAHTGLRVTGGAVVGGRQATELRSSTDLYDIAASDPPYPLRWLDSDSPGPDGTWCGITLDDFGAPVTATMPAAVAGTVGPAPSATPGA